MRKINLSRIVRQVMAVIAIGGLLAAPVCATAADALACNDKRMLIKLQNGYTPEKANLKFKIGGPRETGYGAPPSDAKAVIEKSRYCEAKITLSNGSTDMVYYRLNVLKGGKVMDWVEPCFKNINAKVMNDGCVDHRPQK